MREKRYNFLVGLFVLCGLVSLGALIVLFGQGPSWLMGRNAYELYIYFDAASGIREGTQVTVAGKEIGRVTGVEFKNAADLTKGVQVVVSIREEYELMRGSRAETFEAGLLAGGRPPISIIPGPSDAAPLPPGEAIPGQIRGAVDTIFPEGVVNTFHKTATQIGEAADTLKPVLQDLHEIMQPRSVEAVDRMGGPPGNLSTAMARIDETLRNVNDLLGDPELQEHVRQSVANIHTITDDGRVFAADLKEGVKDARQVVAEIRTFVDNAQGSLDRADEHIDHLARGMMDSLESLNGLLSEAHVAAQRVNRGEGTLGRFAGDPKLYEAMVLTFQRLAATIEELRVLLKDIQERGLKTRL